MSIDLVKDPSTTQKIHDLIAYCGADSSTFDAELVTQQIQTALRLLFEGHDTGQIKLITRALKEMRYAYTIFNQFAGIKRLSIFGSARTPEDHPDYLMAKSLAAEMAKQGWMAITGAAMGIMKAGLEGASRASSFGLSIRLPNEAGANDIIEGDIKLINFNYFFTRKLMFVSHADAVAAFPGGFGTQDELFECLTLMQTGKANLVPIILMQGSNSSYWNHWISYLEENLYQLGWTSPSDRSLYYFAPTVSDAVAHVTLFYRRFHSYRFVKDLLVIRLLKPLTPDQLAQLNQDFPILVKEGGMEQRGALEEETDYPDLPRLTFIFTRRNYGRLRELINTLNALP